MKKVFDLAVDLSRYENKRLPSGFGSVRFLGQGRKKSYVVHPPMVRNSCGKWRRPSALCYVSDRMAGLKILQLYHAGKYE